MESAPQAIITILTGYGALGAWTLYLIWTNHLKDKIIESKDQIIETRNERINELIDKGIEREIGNTRIITELVVLVRSLGAMK